MCLTLAFSEELDKEWFEMWPSAYHKVMRSINLKVVGTATAPRGTIKLSWCDTAKFC